MGLLSWIVLGAVAGWIASLLVGRRGGCCLNIFIGIIGAFIGGFIVQFVTGRGFSIGFNLPSFVVAVVGAVVLLSITSLVGGMRRR